MFLRELVLLLFSNFHLTCQNIHLSYTAAMSIYRRLEAANPDGLVYILYCVLLNSSQKMHTRRAPNIYRKRLYEKRKKKES